MIAISLGSNPTPTPAKLAPPPSPAPVPPFAALMDRTSPVDEAAVAASDIELGSALPFVSGALDSSAQDNESGGQLTVEGQIIRPQPLAFQAGSIIDPRSVVIDNSDQIVSLPEPARTGGFTGSASGLSPSTQLHAAVLPTNMPPEDATHFITAERSGDLTQAELVATARGAIVTTARGGEATVAIAMPPVEQQPADVASMADGRAKRRVVVPAEQVAQQFQAGALRIDLAERHQELSIGIAMPFFDAETTPQLARRIQEVLAAYDHMGARVIVNGTLLSRVDGARGGAGHGGQRN